MIPVPDKSTTKDQSKNEEDQEEYNEGMINTRDQINRRARKS